MSTTILPSIIDFAETLRSVFAISTKEIAFYYCKKYKIWDKEKLSYIAQRLDAHYDILAQIDFEENMYSEPVSDLYKDRGYVRDVEPELEPIVQNKQFKLNSIAEHNKSKIQDQLEANNIEPIDEIVYCLGLWTVNNWHKFDLKAKTSALEFMIDYAKQLENESNLKTVALKI